jgi:transposase
MMGQQTGLQERLFDEFRLDDWVPADHLLRKIDSVLDLRGLRHQLGPFYSHTGRSSVDPELMVRMLLVGYCYGIRSERRLCEETHLNLAYRWFCRLRLEGAIPDQSTFSKNRHGRFRESALFRRVFEGRKVDGKLTTWPETEKITHPVREYLAALDQAAAAEAIETEDAEKDMPPGNPPAAPKVTSLSDPTAARTNKGQMKVGFAYGTNYLIDLQRTIIVDVEAAPARWTAEVAATKTMLERTQQCFGLKPQRLAAGADDRLANAARDRAPHSAARPRASDQRLLHPRRLHPLTRRPVIVLSEQAPGEEHTGSPDCRSGSTSACRGSGQGRRRRRQAAGACPRDRLWPAYRGVFRESPRSGQHTA